MRYLIGDVQGCDEALGRLLDTVGFSPSRDQLVLLGDLVNRGPASLAVLKRLVGYGTAATSLLGNHDLHLLAVAQGLRPAHRSDTLAELLAAPEREALLHWLRHQRLACWSDDGAADDPGHAPWLCVHAGVLPQWDAAQTLALAGEVEAVLRGPDFGAFLARMYGNTPARWDEALQGAERLRVIVNALTRLRFCTADGTMDFQTKEGAGAAPPGHLPWYAVPGRRSAGTPIAFGHWSTLGLIDRPDLLAIDTGCVWGGALTAARVDGGRRELVQVPCPQAQAPGA